MKKPSIYFFYILFFIGLSAKAQTQDAIIDVQHYGFNIKLNDKNDTIRGQADITLKFLQKANSFNIDLVKQNQAGKGMLVSNVTEKGKQVQFQQNSDTLNKKNCR